MALSRRGEYCTDGAAPGEQAGPAHVEAFLSVLRNVTKEDTVQYVLAVLDDMLTGAPGAAPAPRGVAC